MADPVAITLTGTLAVTPTAGLAQAVTVGQNATGDTAAPTRLNQLFIDSDDVNAGNNFVQGWPHRHIFGGPSATGGRTALVGVLRLTAATSASNPNRNYTGTVGTSTAFTTDGGTSPAAPSTTKGAVFGMGAAGVLMPGATAFLNVTGAEFNVAVQAGASVWAKSLFQVSGRNDDAVAGSGVNAMIWLYNQIDSSPKWSEGILFDNNVGGGYPFDTNSTVLRVSGGTIGKGIDFSAATVTGSAFKSPGFSVSGTGIVAVGVNNGVVLTNQVTGAAAAAGTLLNAPKAGNPDFWIPVSVNGTAGWVPWWHA